MLNLKSKQNFINGIYYATLAALFFVMCFNLFYNLGEFPVVDWDEARHGVSAYEMVENNNYVVNTFLGHNDYWNLKPPLSFLSIVLGYKIAGYNLLGFRLFSAISTLITWLLVVWFTRNSYGKVAALIAGGVLSTSTQFLLYHGARTGDADALFVFLFTGSIVFFILHEKNKLFLYFSGLFFSLAFLTKSWHAGSIVFIIGLPLVLMIWKKIINVKQFMLFIASCLLPIIVWGVIRYQYDGFQFFKEMIVYDLLKRTSGALENHEGSILFYIDFIKEHYLYWIFVLFMLVAGFLATKKTSTIFYKKHSLIIFLWIVIPLFLFSLASTKLEWYILPIYPPLAIAIGALFSYGFRIKDKILYKYLLIVCVLCSFLFYEVKIIQAIYTPYAHNEQYVLKKLKEYAGVNIYKSELFDDHEWTQSSILVAKLFADLSISEGNTTAFLKDKGALLLIPNTQDSMEVIKKYTLQVVEYHEDVIVVTNTGADILDKLVDHPETSLLTDNFQLAHEITLNQISFVKTGNNNYKVILKFPEYSKIMDRFNIKIHAYPSDTDNTFLNWDIHKNHLHFIKGDFLYILSEIKTDILEFDRIEVSLYTVNEQDNSSEEYIQNGNNFIAHNIILK